jgi:toxin ParE1/3/4
MIDSVVEWPLARLDLEELAEELGQHHERVAARFLAAVKDAYRLLREMPEAGSLWPTTNPRYEGLRVWPLRRYRNYLIFYRQVNEVLQIVRVQKAARDWTTYFA